MHQINPLSIFEKKNLTLILTRSTLTVACLLVAAEVMMTLHLTPIYPLPRERQLNCNHVAAKLVNHLSGNLTFGMGRGVMRVFKLTSKCTKNGWRCQRGMCNWSQTLTGYAGCHIHDDGLRLL